MLHGYRRGLFAMPYARLMYAWWSPDPRGVLDLQNLRLTRSLRQSCRKYHVAIDQDFEAVLDRCANVERAGAWIDESLYRGYLDLHNRGHAHSVETRDDDGELVGGLFAVNVGGLVAGESMFHTARDASKVALVGLVELLRDHDEPVLLDTQWLTPHLASLGATEISRSDYQHRLSEVVNGRPAL
ncbi:MAG: leucyl/phenylalanyl-tRNA--protein transferase [Candidatus Nanopelagicales bacterium]|nr:leucyl/phenylalanyl-tRNA--protein transferase [Candidatus Nanopelagicales bacterium]